MNIPFPESFASRMRAQLGEDYSRFTEAFALPPCRALRLNRRKGADFSLFKSPPEAVPWAEDGAYISPESGAGLSLWHEAGAFYLQDPGAMIPAAVLGAGPGETLLDFCAAPGGKTTQMAMAMEGRGLLIANEPVYRRAQVLSGNVERMGIPNAIVVSADPEALRKKWPEAFDGVLVDAPCSGEGMFRKNPEAMAEWTPSIAEGCAKRQRAILTAAAGMVRPGGRLVYSTCTWNPAENEEMIAWFLSRFQDFSPEPFSLPGIDGASGLFTAYPHLVRGEGQFTALLRRRGTGEAALPAAGRGNLPREDSRRFAEAFPTAPAADRLFGNTLISLPFCPDLDGITVLRLGLHLGWIRSGIPLPDHALAMCFLPSGLPTVALNPEQALRYLAGETLSAEGIPGLDSAGDSHRSAGVHPSGGWRVATCGGFPLGWVKCSDGMLKNHYPKGLRNHRISADKI